MLLCIWPYLYCVICSLCHTTLFSSLLAHHVDTTPSISSSCRKLAPNGTLTLGATHRLVNGDIEIIPFPNPVVKLSLFRLWGRERSKQEVTSLKCTEGDLVKWDRNNWDTQICAPLPDSNLKCGELVENILYINWNNVFSDYFYLSKTPGFKILLTLHLPQHLQVATS